MNTPPLPTPARTPRPVGKSIRDSVLFRLGIIGVLVLVLLVPLSRVKGLVSERLSRADGAKKEIASIWGGRQEIGGPVIVVPYRVHFTDAVGGHEKLRVSDHLDIARVTGFRAEIGREGDGCSRGPGVRGEARR